MLLNIEAGPLRLHFISPLISKRPVRDVLTEIGVFNVLAQGRAACGALDFYTVSVTEGP